MKKLSLFLIIAGIVIILIPIAGQAYTAYRDHKMISDWESNPEVIDTTSETNPQQSYEDLQRAFNEEGTPAQVNTTPKTPAPSVLATPAPTSAPTPKPQIVLGIIKIDKIKVRVPVVEGVKTSNLSVGVGHIPGTAAIGQKGNCALAGHRSYTFGKFFNRLDELDIGDTIVITTKKKDYKYIVYDKLVVLPEDVSVLKPQGDDKILTLVTCTPVHVATHRLIVHAKMAGN